MAKYLLVYYGGKIETDPKMAKKSMEDWLKWFKGLGMAMIDSGAPTMPGKIVSGNGVRSIGTKPVTGYSILQAATQDDAVKIARTCPIIADGGQVAVYTLMPM